MASLKYKDTLMLLYLDKMLVFPNDFKKNLAFETDFTTIWSLKHKIKGKKDLSIQKKSIVFNF